MKQGLLAFALVIFVACGGDDDGGGGGGSHADARPQVAATPFRSSGPGATSRPTTARSSAPSRPTPRCR